MVDDFDSRNHHESDESSTEVGDSLLGEEEKQWVDAVDSESACRQRHKTRRTCIGAFFMFLRNYCWLINMLLLLTAVVFLFMLHVQTEELYSPTSPWQIGGNYAGEGPSCKLTTRLFLEGC